MIPAESDRLKTFVCKDAYGEIVEITNDAGNLNEEFDILEELDLPTARRLVAAWNAAIGVSTESLENGVSVLGLRCMLRRVLETCHLSEDDTLQGDIERLLA